MLGRAARTKGSHESRLDQEPADLGALAMLPPPFMQQCCKRVWVFFHGKHPGAPNSPKYVIFMYFRSQSGYNLYVYIYVYTYIFLDPQSYRAPSGPSAFFGFRRWQPTHPQLTKWQRRQCGSKVDERTCSLVSTGWPQA